MCWHDSHKASCRDSTGTKKTHRKAVTKNHILKISVNYISVKEECVKMIICLSMQLVPFLSIQYMKEKASYITVAHDKYCDKFACLSAQINCLCISVSIIVTKFDFGEKHSSLNW
jgi:hypothetical protein